MNRKEDWPRCIKPRPNELRINNLTLLFGRLRQTLICCQAYCQIFCCCIQGDLQEYPRREEKCKTTKQIIDEKPYSSIVCVADDEDHMKLKTIVHLAGKLKFS